MKELGIPNFHLISNNSARGEALSSKKNRKFIEKVKECGIKNIVDLREKYSSTHYQALCDEAGLKYYSIPIDSASVEDRVVIDNMPKLFKALDEGNTYIACAQGLHRTDIALALDYMFNPKTKDIPLMYGHFREQGFKSEDIIRRINSVFKTISDKDAKNLGWENKVAIEEAIQKRKADFMALNKKQAEI